MNNYQNNYQCNNCQKGFAESEIYQAGKEKNLFCRECCRNIRNCSWCQKETKEREGFICWKQGTEHQQDDGSWMTTKIGEYNLFCSGNCRNNYKENTPEKLAERQQRQELLDKGYKPYGKNFIKNRL